MISTIIAIIRSEIHYKIEIAQMCDVDTMAYMYDFYWGQKYIQIIGSLFFTYFHENERVNLK